MNTITKISGKAFVVSTLALALNGVLYADTAPVLTLGETITVVGTSDGVDTTGCPAACPTLRSAVIFANNNGNGATEYDVINLGAGTHALTIAGTNEGAAADGDLDLTEAVNFVGVAGFPLTTIIDGGGSGGTLQERIFTVDGVQVGISDIAMTNGYAHHELGGAIFNDEKGILTLTNCAITDSVATWDGDYITDTSTGGVSDTPPDGVPGTALLPEGTKETQGSGGAIYSKDVMTIENCVFRGNIAENYEDTGVPDPDPHHTGNIIIKVGNGGAINASQHTVINNSTFGSDAAIDITSNRAINGGGIFMTGGNPFEVTSSTFSYNWAISGGGICNVSPSAPTTITNTTVSGNQVTDSGAGIETNAAMELFNVTIANNVKDSSTKGSGLNTGPSVSITAKNVLFDNNLADGLAVSANCGAKGGGFALTSQGGNVASDGTCDLNVALGDQEDVSSALIDLQPLADNNGGGLPGTTLTHALTLASAAVDTGVNTGCPNNDQRGSIRPFDATLLLTPICDSGAYELYVERTDLHIENLTAPSAAIEGTNVTIDAVIDNGAAVAGNVVVTTYLPAEMTYVSATTVPAETCVHAAGVVTCTFTAPLAAGAEVSVSIVAEATTAGDDVIVTVNAATDTLDPNLTNNVGTVMLDIAKDADLAMTAATVSPASINTGVTTSVSLTVENLGPNAATGVQVTAAMPALVSFVQGVGCVEAGGIITCDVGALANAATANVSFDVKGETAGTASITSTVTSDLIDTDPSDNSKTVDVAITVKSSSGGLCSYDPKAVFDPVLPALILSALGFLGFRRLRRESISRD